MREIKFRYWDKFNAVMVYMAGDEVKQTDAQKLESFFARYLLASNGEKKPLLMQ